MFETKWINRAMQNYVIEPLPFQSNLKERKFGVSIELSATSRLDEPRDEFAATQGLESALPRLNAECKGLEGS